MAGPLDGIRIIDLTTVVLGPWASQMLGDLGADVIKVETPGGDMSRQAGPHRNPAMASLFLTTNRNKRSIVLDLRNDTGRDALGRLIATADVFVHNLRPKVVRKLELEYERFAGSCPDLVYCAAYGYRADGPMADNPAYDDIIQAACGLAEMQTVVADAPRYVPTLVADKTTSFHVVGAILAALLHRERGGAGQAIEVPMFESMVDYMMVEHLYGAVFEPPVADMGYERLLTSQRRPYPTRDGYLAVLPYSDANWQALFEVAGRDDLKSDPRFADMATRVRHSEEIYGILAAIVATRTTAEWLRELGRHNVPVQEVFAKEDLPDNPQLLATGFWQIVDHPSEGELRMPGPPVRFSRTPAAIHRLPPGLGEHGREILLESGFNETEIDALSTAGTIRPQAGRGGKSEW